LHECLRRVEFHYLSVAQNKHFITFDDCVQSMGDGDDCRVFKEFFQQGLDSFFGNDIDVRSSFIENYNLRFSHNGTTNANKLLLTCTEVATVFRDVHVQI